ncbi:MraY family glycosyltransferase [Parabacteroides merdae]|uniref:MraY family glycosyltransferase n=1 Tax=Parabacteroides merdae TaxID=46503 RepID=UPI0034A3ECF0
MDILHLIEFIFTVIVGYTLSAMALPRISLVSFRRRLFDQIDGRKLHTAHIPRLGGIAFFPCITITVSLAIIFHNLWMDSNMLDMNLTNRLLSVFCCLFLLYLTGMMDDLISVRYRSKFMVQIVCGVLLVTSGLCLDNLHGLFGIGAIPYYIGAPFTVFIIVYILNAINLIDGIDGLASGLSIIAFFAFGCMFIRLQWWMYAFIAFASFGVLLPFFYKNVYGNVQRGRKIFMGDTGSLTIGMLLAVMAIRLSMSDPVKESVFPGAIVIAFSFLIVPMLDVVRVVLHRWRSRKPLFLPDKNHIHHKFIALGMSQRQAMAGIICIAFTFAVVNVFLIHYLSTTLLFLLDVAVWTMLHCYITIKINRKNRLENKLYRNKI